jgi:putative lipoprotein
MNRHLCTLTILAGALATTALPAAAQEAAGRWRAELIRGGAVIDGIQTILTIAPDGAVSGTGGCNRMAGRATISGDAITFGRIASTRMGCAPAVMDQESKFFAALEDVRAWRIDPARQRLALLDADGKQIVVLARM